MRRKAARLLDDGTRSVAPPLKPLADALAGSASLTATFSWLRKPHIQELLTHLACGKMALTHEALDAWPGRRAVHYLRDDVMLATMDWVQWYNEERIHSYSGDMPPKKYEVLGSGK